MKALASKMVKVMSELKRVAKNGRNDFHKYDYITESDVLDTVRETLVKHNIFIYSSVVASHKEADMTSVQMQHTIVDADSGESQNVLSIGQGQDKGDKGSNKAITSAVKYFFLKTFLLSSGDDPEATDAEGKSTGPKKTLAVASSSDSTNEVKVPPKKYGFSGKPVLKTAEVKGTSDGFGN